MSSGQSPTPELVFKIAKVAVHTELLPPSEVATAPTGAVTESFGPTQITLADAHVTGKLNPDTPYVITAGTPHNYRAPNMHYVHKLADGSLLFRAPTPKA